jgi:hypothetical protein
VALGEPPVGDGPRPVLAIGEVKWGRRPGPVDLDRLERARRVVAARPGIDGSDIRLLLASAGGFAEELVRLAGNRPDLILVDPTRLYGGE